MEKKKDIVVVLSDQHNGFYTSLNLMMDDITPNLKRIAKDGCCVEQAYCNSPLCVPSRMSFLTGKSPLQTGIMNNDSTLNSDEITIAHKIGMEGYETILVGRMHFKGLDQFHGFDQRFIGDITNQYWGMSRNEIKEFHQSFGSKHCQDLIGVGESPIMDFDYQVFQKAYELLSQPREKPLFLVIGFYSPHYPYISEQIDLQVTSSVNQEDYQIPCYPEYESYVQESCMERIEHINKAYKKMIFKVDEYIGKLFDLYRLHSDGLFVYTSDHGDQLGKRSIFGKRTLYEDSIRIPMVLHGWKPENKIQQIDLLGLHEILVEYARNHKTKKSMDEPVVVQTLIKHENKVNLCEAVIYHGYKLVSLHSDLYLYYLPDDENEVRNLVKEQSDICQFLKQYLSSPKEKQDCIKNELYQQQNIQVLNAHGKMKNMVYDMEFCVKDQFKPKKEYQFRKDEIQCSNQ